MAYFLYADSGFFRGAAFLGMTNGPARCSFRPGPDVGPVRVEGKGQGRKKSKADDRSRTECKRGKVKESSDDEFKI